MHWEYMLKGRINTEARNVKMSKWKFGIVYGRMGADENTKQKKIQK